MVLSAVRTAGKHLVQKKESENEAMLSALMALFVPGLETKDHENFNRIMTDNGFKSLSFVFAKNEKAEHPKFDSELFQRKCAMFADIADRRHAIQVLGWDMGIVEAIAKANDYNLLSFDVRDAPGGKKGIWLYGLLENDVWNEGVLTKAFKDCLSGDMSKKQGLKLIHLKMEKFDAIVAENLNTMMDDNKVLCLANGERVPLGSDVRIVIETSSCELESPATVSRCGFVNFVNAGAR